jgi:glycosyltransferase involved in cell wall biosynthesis/ribosomal protein S18 acetylase RimI-like enzyme
VITNFPNRPAGKVYDGYKRVLFATEECPRGFRLVRCFSFLSRESSLLSRWLENISFGLTSSLALLFSPRPDVVYANTWPIFATGLTCLVCKIRNVPIVIHVQDMYPESLVTQGRLKPGQWLYKLLLSIDRWIAGQASALIVLSDKFARGYTQLRQIPPSKVHIIADWLDSGSVVVLGKNNYRQEIDVSGEAFVMVYGGNVGMAAGVNTVIDAMRMVKSKREIVLVIAGSGSQLAACQKLGAEVTNVRIMFHTPWASDETSKVLAAADVLLLPTRGTQSLASVPSKLLSYLLAARPVLAAVLPESDTAQVIEKAGCGWIVPPDNKELLARKIEELAGLPEQLLGKMGFAGRQYAMQNFTTETCLPKVIKIIENAALGECTMNIRAMRMDDCAAVVSVHLRSFQGFFLTFLGSRFLNELYAGILGDPSGIAYVREAEGCLIGFVAGTDHPAGFYQRLLGKRWWRFGLASLPAILKNPRVVLRLFRALSMPKQVTVEKDRGTLMSIAVLPGEQSKGIGRGLVNAFLEEAAKRGLRQVDLTTDKLNNDSVNAFYLRLGFVCSRCFVTAEGREMNEYSIDLRGIVFNE